MFPFAPIVFVVIPEKNSWVDSESVKEMLLLSMIGGMNNGFWEYPIRVYRIIKIVAVCFIVKN